MDRSLLRDRLLAMGLAAAGVVLAMFAVYVGTGLHDGFGDWELHRLGRRFRRYLPYALPLAAGMGLVLHAYYSALLRATPAPWTLLISIPRAFLHFAFFGMLVLLAFIGLFAWHGLAWLVRRLRGVTDADTRFFDDGAHRIGRDGIALPLWFMWFPFTLMSGASFAVDVEGDDEFAGKIARGLRQPGFRSLTRRMLVFLPWLTACVFLWVGAESEDTGNRVDPYWLTAVASIWFTDYLMVALRVVPALRARLDAAP